MKKLLSFLGALLLASSALAQTVPTRIGVTHGTPNSTFCLYDKTGACASFATVNNTTHAATISGSVGVTISSGDVTTALGYTPLRPSNNLSDIANAATARANLGITGTGGTLTSSDITTALGYTPLNPANNLSDVPNDATAATNLSVLPNNAPSFTGEMLASTGGYVTGSSGIGGYLFAQGNGTGPFSYPQVDWYNFGGATNAKGWMDYADASKLHRSTFDDAFSVTNDYMVISRSGATPTDVKLLNATILNDTLGNYGLGIASTTIPHFSGTNVSGIPLIAGGATMGYLVNPNPATGWSVGQLYVNSYTGQPNSFGAPIFFNIATTNGNNRAIAINLTDTSTAGSLQVTGLSITQNSPPDRGGDTSGMYISQSGGGNGISVYKLSSTFPNNGFAIESRSDGTASSIYTSAVNGDAAGIEVTGASGQGVDVWYKTATNGGTATTSNRAFKVRDFANTTENFYVLMDGSILSKSTSTIAGGIITGSTTLHTTNVALSNAAAAATATMTNAPVAGNPTKWISINDNGTTRRIPAW